MTDDELKAIERRHELAADQVRDSCNLSMLEAIDDIPALLAEVERQRAEIERLREALRDIERGDYSDPMCERTPEQRAREALEGKQ